MLYRAAKADDPTCPEQAEQALLNAVCDAAERARAIPAGPSTDWTERVLRWAREQLDQPLEAPGETSAAWSHFRAGIRAGTISASVPSPNHSASLLPFISLPEEEPLYAAVAAQPITYIQGSRNDWLTCAINLLCQHLQRQHRILLTANNAANLQAIVEKLSPALRMFDSTPAAQSEQQSQAYSAVQLERELENLNQLRNKTEDALIAQIEAESQTVALSGLSGSPSSIGRYVEQHQARDGWLGTSMNDGEEIPLTATQLEELRSWWATEAAGQRAESADLIEQLRKLPDVSLVQKLVGEWSKERQLRSSGAESSQAAALAAAKIDVNLVAATVDPIRKAAASLRKLPKLEGWIQTAVTQTMAGSDAWICRKGKLDRVIPLLKPVIDEIGSRTVEVKTQESEKQLREALHEMSKHLKGGRSLSWVRSWLDWKVARWRKQLQHVRIDNKPCYRLPELQLILKWLELKKTLELTWQDWKGIAAPKSDSLADQQAKLLALQSTLGKLLPTLEPYTIAKAQVAGLFSGSGAKPVELPVSTDPAALDSFAANLEAYVAKMRQPKLAHPFKAPLEVLEKLAQQHPGSQLVRQVISALQACNAADYQRALQQIAQQIQHEKRRQRAKELVARLVETMPGFAHQLQATATDEVWRTRLPAARSAWVWSQAYRWLREFSSARNANTLHHRHAEIMAATSRVVIQLAASQSLAATHEANHQLPRCEQLIPGCCWAAVAADVLSTPLNCEQPPFDVVLLLTDRQLDPCELMLLAAGRQFVVLEQVSSAKPAQLTDKEPLTWKNVLSRCGVNPSVLPPLDPLALPVLPFMEDGAQINEDAAFRSEVARRLLDRNFPVRQTIVSQVGWQPTLIIADLAAPIAVQCYGQHVLSPEALRHSFLAQARWRQAGWQVRHVYASDFFARGDEVLRTLVDPSVATKVSEGRGPAKTSSRQPPATQNAPTAAKDWQRLMRMGAKLQFNEEQQLIVVDFRQTLATRRELAELADCPTLHTVHFPVHTSDDTLRELTWLQQLTGLNLSYAQISDRGLALLEPNAKLRWLGLCGTRITDQGLESLKPLQSLVDLDLRMTQISERACTELKNNLPNCRVQFSAISKALKKKAAATESA